MPDGKGKPGRQARRTASMSLAVCTMLRVGSTAWLGVNTSKPSINSAGHNSSAQPILRLATLDQQHGDPSPLDDRQHQPAEVRGPVQLVVHGGDQRPARGHPRSPRRCSGGPAAKLNLHERLTAVPVIILSTSAAPTICTNCSTSSNRSAARPSTPNPTMCHHRHHRIAELTTMPVIKGSGPGHPDIEPVPERASSCSLCPTTLSAAAA